MPVGVGLELPLEVRAHLALHLVGLAQREEVLADDGPGLIRVRVVTDDLTRNHEGGEEVVAAAAPVGRGEAHLEAVEQNERGVVDGGAQAQRCRV